jgi:hypothetical protein
MSLDSRALERAGLAGGDQAGSAVFSRCGRYRYLLRRRVGRTGAVAAVIMVNPSTADASSDDATIRRLIGFAGRLGWREIVVANLFGLISSDVQDLAGPVDACGPRNGAYLRKAMRCADVVIAAWGTTLKLPGALRRQWTLPASVAAELGRELQCFGTARDGHPLHPLFLPYTSRLLEWRPPLH